MRKNKRIKHEIEPLYAVDDPQFVRSMSSLLGPALCPGNKIETLLNGDQIFPAMLAAIASAEHNITFETYIFWSGKIGKQFAEALTERARAGVRVHVLLDWVGSGKMDSKILQQMRDADVEVVKYHPLRWFNVLRLNNRTHRKLLIIDGKVGFAGGVGIADDWLGNAASPSEWRDTHFKLTGPAVSEMQAAFMENWLKTETEVLHGHRYFPELEPTGNHLAQVFKSSPQEGGESVRLMYLLSIVASRKNIRLSNPYFVPEQLAISTLVDAAERGVQIEIIVPGKHMDVELARSASRGRWGKLLAAGVKIYEFQPTMFHCKSIVVDDVWVSVGSTNFDSRSFHLNDEANLNVYDRDFAAAQVKIFEEDKLRSSEVTYEAWLARPWWLKARERFAAIFESQI